MDRIDSRQGLPFIGSPSFGWRGAIVVATIAILLPVATLLLLGAAGTATRVPQGAESPSPIRSVVTSSGPAAVRLLEEEGVHGAHIVQASRDFGYRVENLEMSITPGDAAGEAASATQLFRERLDSTNYLYVATRLGIARRVTHLMTSAAFERKVAEGRAQGMPGIAEDGGSVVLNQDGDLREIYPRLPQMSGDVILLVNASYFEDGTIAELVSSFEANGLRVVLVVASLDDDDPSVSHGAREQMLELLTNIEQGVLE